MTDIDLRPEEAFERYQKAAESLMWAVYSRWLTVDDAINQLDKVGCFTDEEIATALVAAKRKWDKRIERMQESLSGAIMEVDSA